MRFGPIGILEKILERVPSCCFRHDIVIRPVVVSITPYKDISVQSHIYQSLYISWPALGAYPLTTSTIEENISRSRSGTTGRVETPESLFIFDYKALARVTVLAKQ